MNFFSIKEFFYKLNTIGFILLLLPLVVFVLLYTRSIEPGMDAGREAQAYALLGTFVGIIVLILTIVHLLIQIRLKKMQSFLELAKKMDGYFVLMVVRSSAYTAGLLLLALGFHLTTSMIFTGTFLAIVLVVIVQWPRPVSFCRQLNLRGSERDMVLHNRDLPSSYAKKSPDRKKWWKLFLPQSRRGAK